MAIKLTEGQQESFALLHANICNALIYAEDLAKNKEIHFRETMPPVVTKLKWLKTALDLRIPPDRRMLSKNIDTLRFDEIARLMVHMDDQQLNALENYANSLFE